MAAKEIYDYLAGVDADYTAANLTIKAQGTVTEEGFKNQKIHLADDNSEERITLGSTSSIFFMSWEWSALSESDSGTIFDFYHDPTKANGIARSFYLDAYDGHTYTVRFDCKLTRSGQKLTRMGFSGVRLKVLGRLPISSTSQSASLSPSASKSPSKSPSLSPSASKSPSSSPSRSHSMSPSKSPSASPSKSPSKSPSSSPSVSPSKSPSKSPSASPSASPST